METEFWQKDIELMNRKDLEAFQLGCLKKTLKTGGEVAVLRADPDGEGHRLHQGL